MLMLLPLMAFQCGRPAAQTGRLMLAPRMLLPALRPRACQLKGISFLVAAQQEIHFSDGAPKASRPSCCLDRDELAN